MDVLLTGIQMLKIMNCVTLSFRNIEMYSRNYVVSYHSKYLWINILYQRVLVKSSNSHKCYINMLLYLNNCMQHVQIIKY